MNRAAFLTPYIIIALLLSGGLANPWTITVMALAYGQQGPISLLSPIFIISVFSPIVLIVLAHLRGKRIGIPSLVWFPIAALGLTLLPILFGLLTKSFSGLGKEWSLQTIGLYSTMFVAAASSLGPLILHTICCVVGGKRDPASVISTLTRSSATNPWKIVVVMVLLLVLSGGYYYFSRSVNTEKMHWEEEAALHDGRTLDVQRTVALTYSKGGEPSAHKSPNYYSLKVSHPDTGKLIEWDGEYGFNPILIDFVDGVPYLAILQFNVFANLKQYGCPEIPYVFFRYDASKDRWEQISGSAFPVALLHANLKAAFYGNVNIEEGLHLTKEMVANNNLWEETAGGYFTNAIPKDFNSWTYKFKERAKKDHHHDGCRPAQEVIPTLPPGQQVSLDVIEKNTYKPEWIIENANEPASPWASLSWDRDRNEMCKSLLRPEEPGVQGWSFFVKDPSGKKRMRDTGSLICDGDNIWAFDYAVEKGRVVIAKYKSNGDLSYRISFAKPDEPGWYLGSIMRPTFKAENGYLFFEWWNFNHSGRDVRVKRSMKVKIQEPTVNVSVNSPAD